MVASRPPSPRVAHAIRKIQTKSAQATGKPNGNYDHATFQFGVVNAVNAGPPPTVDVYLDGAQNTTQTSGTANLTKGIAYLASYVPTVGDTVFVYRGSGNSSSDRMVLGKAAGAASPGGMLLPGYTNGVWTRGPNRVWQSNGVPTIPIAATAGAHNAINGDWCNSVTTPHQYQAQAGKWVQVV